MLAVSVEGPAAIVRVRDPGPGIAAADLPHVFERLYRGDPARGRQEGHPGGTGIGLTVARELIEANGGRLSIESSTPDGTTLRIDLPQTRGAERR
jgi:signal transduction histidine kinase